VVTDSPSSLAMALSDQEHAAVGEGEKTAPDNPLSPLGRGLG
jgi:hypothetical protein